MKNLLTAGALSCALLASGCANTPSGGTGTTSAITPSQIIADAQAAALALCAVSPTAAAITSIIIAQDASAAASEAEATQAAQLFCTAVAANQKLSRVKRLRAVSGHTLLDFGTTTINGKVIDLQGFAG